MITSRLVAGWPNSQFGPRRASPRGSSVVKELERWANSALAGHTAAGRVVGDLVGQETPHRASVDREDEPLLPGLPGKYLCDSG